MLIYRLCIYIYTEREREILDILALEQIAAVRSNEARRDMLSHVLSKCFRVPVPVVWKSFTKGQQNSMNSGTAQKYIKILAPMKVHYPGVHSIYIYIYIHTHGSNQ